MIHFNKCIIYVWELRIIPIMPVAELIGGLEGPPVVIFDNSFHPVKRHKGESETYN